MAGRRWLKIGGGIAASVTTIIGLFLLLQTQFGFEINDLTGNFTCLGTYENPCISEFEVRNPTMYNVDIYSKDQVKLNFSPEIKDWALFVPDGRCSATGKCACELKNGQRLGFEDWRCVDFTNKTKPRADRVYNFRFKRYSTTKFKLAGIKKDPRNTIKWTFGAKGGELDPLWKGFSDETDINKNANYKKTSLSNFSIASPNSVKCTWGLDGKKHCNTIIIIENGLNQTYKFDKEKINIPFDRAAQNLKLEYSTNFTKVQKEILDWDCIEKESEKERNMTIERAREIDDISKEEDYFQSICKEEIIDYEFTDWQPLILSNLDQVSANSVIGIKLQFDTELWRGLKAKNNFNISLMGQDFDLVLDPEIDDCMDITASGAYTLNQTITMGTTPCLNISANNVVLDCDGYKIDGTSTGSAIYVRRATGQDVNVTILDCSVDDTTYALDIRNANNLNVTNFYSWSAGTYGIYTYTSDLGVYKNITVDGDNDPTYGIYYYEGDNGKITDLILYDATTQNFRSYDSVGLNFTNVLSYSGPRGMVLRYPYSGIANINIINLTTYDNTYTGLQLDQISDVDVSNSKIYNNSQYDFDMSPSVASHCDGHSFTNVNITDSKGGITGTITYKDSASQTIENDDFELIVFCDADNSVINNVTIKGYSGDAKNGLLIYLTDGLNITNSIFNYTYDGIAYDGGDSFNGLIKNNQFYNTQRYDLTINSYGNGVDVINNSFTSTIYAGAQNIIIINNTFVTGTDYVIYEGADADSTVIYNNIFNKSNGAPYVDSSSGADIPYNTSQQAGGRIVGNGTDIGGNVYYNSTGGYYLDCADSNMNGICDNSLDMGDVVSEAIDYLALSDEYIADAFNPWWIIGSNSTNDTTANTNILFSLNWKDDIVLDKYIFSWRNGGNWTLDNSSSDQESGTQSEEGQSGEGGTPSEYYDDFESDFGHWAVHQGINCPDADAWGDRGTSTPSSSTGPQSGGVGGAGTYFIFVESSSGNCYDTGDIALVYFNTTLDYDSSSGEKIEFYFDAYGATIDDLYLEENSTGSWVKLWEMHDISNDYWNFTSIDLSSLTGAGTLRFNYTRTSTGYTSDIALDRINVTTSGGGVEDNEANKTAITYSNVLSGGYDEVKNITTTVYVSYYNNSGSEENGNNNATLWLEIYNGSDWLDEGDFSVNGDNQNFSITTTTASILTGWETDANRNARISARYIDYNSTTNESDVINWTGIWVSMFTEQEWFNESEISFVTGDCTNDSKTDCWSNSSHTVTSDVGALIEWRYYVWDGVEKTNYSDIFSFVTTGGAEDSCTYTGGNWNVDCSDNCVISSDVTIDGSNIYMTGTGTFTINNGVKISGWTYRYTDRTCYVKAFGSGGFFQ